MMAKPSSTNYPKGFHSKNFFSFLSVDERETLLNLLVDKIKVVIAARSHLFPFRTEKLSSLTPMVLQFLWESR